MAIMNLPAIFATIAGKVTTAMGAPFHDGFVMGSTAPVYDDGGSIITPGTATQRACKVQIDAATDYMRANLGYTDQDVVFIILAASLTGTLNTDAKVHIPSGPRAGAWDVSEISMDPASIGYSGKASRA